MKKKYIFPVILGGTFFAVPYLALNIPILPSAVVAGVAYGAGWLIFRGKETEDKFNLSNQTDEMAIKNAKNMTIKLSSFSKIIEDKKLIANVNEIVDISNKILDTLEKKPEKMKNANNFLNYYLPVTIKILERYDEIENQKLETEKTKKFMSSIQEMVEKIKIAFKEQLENMYHSDMIDTNAEIKVFESMLKADGFLLDDDFKKEE